MRISKIITLSREQVNILSRSDLYDIYKLINPHGSVKKLALDFGYTGQQPQDSIRRICKGEGKNRRNNNEVIKAMRENINEYIKKHNITQEAKEKLPEEAEVLQT